MPATTYMQIDPRRDHGMRIPRPDLSVALAVPNACTGCHTGESDSWAAARVEEWYGGVRGGFIRFAEGFAGQERGQPRSDSAVAGIATDTLQPDWVRASALARLVGSPAAAMPAARGALTSADPMLRRAALGIVEAASPPERRALATSLLGDPSRAVRLQAAWVLAPVATTLTGEASASFERAAEEFIASQRLLADRPESRVTLGTFFTMLGRFVEAEAEFRTSIRRSPDWGPAYVNLADLLRLQGREEDARQALTEGLAAVPRDASVHHALGLAFARAGRTAEAVAELSAAADLAPENPRYSYAHAVALNSTGETTRAIEELQSALTLHPSNRDLLFALATILRDAGQLAAALQYAERLAAAHPADEGGAALVAALRRPAVP
jgi:tetratricopeptide (TPR) repeat protein